jgi:hypothetical protein
MVEIHLMRRKGSFAIRARSLSKLPQQVDRSVLPHADSGDLELSVPSVIGDVRRTLIASRHRPSL